MKLIIDGDFGGDEMQLLAVALANQKLFSIIGLTTVFGNTSGEQVTKNALSLATFLNAEHLPVYAGHYKPIDREILEGDGAHGSDGIGGVEFPISQHSQQNQHAVDFIIQTLLDNPEKSITITATGPQTNIAAAIRKNPKAMSRVNQIIIMGGATEMIPANDMPFRKGNITPNAEFNFQQDAIAANEVLQSGLPITLIPMNCTHQLTVTPTFEQELRAVLSSEPYKAHQVIQMMSAPKDLDRKKFGIDPVMHDVNTILYAMYPNNYHTKEASITVTSEGECILNTSEMHTIQIAYSIIDTNLLHDEVKASLQSVLL